MALQAWSICEVMWAVLVRLSSAEGLQAWNMAFSLTVSCVCQTGTNSRSQEAF